MRLEMLRVTGTAGEAGSREMPHQPNEWVATDQFVKAVRFYYELARRYLTA